MKKTAYLTIDDCPTEDLPAKLDLLEKYQIPAILFCEGKRMETFAEITKDAIQRGFVIGNHSYSHPAFSDIPLSQCLEEIRRTDEIINAIYASIGAKRAYRFFRFPYGDKGALTGHNVFAPYSPEGLERKKVIQSLLRELNYTQPAFDDVTYSYYRALGLLDDIDWYWTYDCREWSIFQEQPLDDIDSIEKVLARMDENMPEGGRGLNWSGSAEIILLHDHVETTSHWQAIIEKLREKPLAFKLAV